MILPLSRLLHFNCLSSVDRLKLKVFSFKKCTSNLGCCCDTVPSYECQNFFIKRKQDNEFFWNGNWKYCNEIKDEDEAENLGTLTLLAQQFFSF